MEWALYSALKPYSPGLTRAHPSRHRSRHIRPSHHRPISRVHSHTVDILPNDHPDVRAWLSTIPPNHWPLLEADSPMAGRGLPSMRAVFRPSRPERPAVAVTLQPVIYAAKCITRGKHGNGEWEICHDPRWQEALKQRLQHSAIAQDQRLLPVDISQRHSLAQWFVQVCPPSTFSTLVVPHF